MAVNANWLHEETLNPMDKVALFLTRIVGTMWCFYLFCILAFVPLVFPQTLAIVQFVSSGFLQLVLLPLILVGTALQSRHAEVRADLEFETTMREERENKEILKRLERMEKQVLHLVDQHEVMSFVWDDTKGFYTATGTSFTKKKPRKTKTQPRKRVLTKTQKS